MEIISKQTMELILQKIIHGLKKSTQSQNIITFNNKIANTLLDRQQTHTTHDSPMQ